MKVYIVVASDCEGSYIEEVFSSIEKAEEYANFKNKYKTPRNTFDTFHVIEKELLEKANLDINEDDLCVKISGYIDLSGYEDENKIEYELVVKEDWCVTTFGDCDTCISVDMYIKLSKDEFDNFEQSKYEYIFKELKDKVKNMHKQGLTSEEIVEKLYENL